MTGESDLTKLLQGIKPELHEGEYVFCLIDSMEPGLAYDPVCLFQEMEGVTAIIPRQTADLANIPYPAVFAWITLTVHSSLEAVGLTAAVSRALTMANISCNVVAAYHHDHLFVPVNDAGRAMQVLNALTEAHHEGKQILETFWAVMATNDFRAAAELLHDDFTLEWPQSGERIRGREHFVLINTHYPADGMWQFRINAIAADDEIVVSDVSVSDGKRQDRAITFSTIRDGKIWKQVEFWPEPFEAPAWRADWVEKI